MIDCKECIDYAHMVHAKGDITVEEIQKLAIDRHVLKGCESGQTIGFWDSSKVPMDIICNGFSIKQTIIDVLNPYEGINYLDEERIEKISEEIKEAFAVKLRLKQGEVKAFEGCIHEGDGMIYTSNPPQNKCKKCGEFYR
jgi:hypothetical protein